MQTAKFFLKMLEARKAVSLIAKGLIEKKAASFIVLVSVL
jgi:hypothetical protein